MKNFVIIDVDLGYSVDDIIKEDIVEITSKMTTEIETAVTVAKASQQVKDAKKIKDEKADKIIETIYNKLTEPSNTDNKLPYDYVIHEIDGLVANIGAFATRMRTYLRNNGNTHVLIKKKINQEYFYVLEHLG